MLQFNLFWTLNNLTTINKTNKTNQLEQNTETLWNEIMWDIDESVKDIYNDLCYMYEDIMPSLLNSFEEQSIMWDIKKELLFVKYKMSQIISCGSDDDDIGEEDGD